MPGLCVTRWLVRSCSPPRLSLPSMAARLMLNGGRVRSTEYVCNQKRTQLADARPQLASALRSWDGALARTMVPHFWFRSVARGGEPPTRRSPPLQGAQLVRPRSPPVRGLFPPHDPLACHQAASGRMACFWLLCSAHHLAHSVVARVVVRASQCRPVSEPVGAKGDGCMEWTRQ